MELRKYKATLGEVVDDPEEEGRSLLSFKINDGEEVLLCSLRLKNKEMCVLDLKLDGLANVVFSVKGPREIHLVGSYRDFHVKQSNVNHGVVPTAKESTPKILLEDDSNKETVTAKCCSTVNHGVFHTAKESTPKILPPNEVRSPTCSFQFISFSHCLMNCVYPAELDIPKQRKPRIKLQRTSKYTSSNVTCVLGSFQPGSSKHAQSQDEPYEGSCLRSIRRELDFDILTKHMSDPCEKSEEVLEKAATSLRMEDQIKSFATISIEPTMVVEHSEEVAAAEQGAFDTTQVISSKHDSDGAGKFERERDKHLIAMPNDASHNAAEDDHNSNGIDSKRKKKSKDKHLVAPSNDIPTRNGNDVDGDYGGNGKKKRKRINKHLVIPPNDTHEGNIVDGDNEGKNRKQKREDKHLALQNDAQTHGGNKGGDNDECGSKIKRNRKNKELVPPNDTPNHDGNNADGDNDGDNKRKRKRKNKDLAFPPYDFPSGDGDAADGDNESVSSRKKRKQKRKDKRVVAVRNDSSTLEGNEDVTNAYVDNQGEGKKEKKQKKQGKGIDEDDDNRCAEHGDTKVSVVDFGEGNKKLKDKEKVEDVKNRPLGSNAEAKEVCNNLSRIPGFICALPAVLLKER